MCMAAIDAERCFSILHRRSKFFVAAACERLQITYLEYVMLLQIFSAEGMSQEDLVSVLRLDKAVVARTISLLEQKGMICRRRDSGDHRMKRLYPTEKAKAGEEYLEDVICTWMDYLLQDMDPEASAAFMSGISKVSERACRANLSELVQGIGKKREEKEKNEKSCNF